MIKSIDKRIRSAKKEIQCSDCQTKPAPLVTDGGKSHNAEGAKKVMEEHLEFAEKELWGKMMAGYPKAVKKKGLNKHRGGQNAYQSS